MKTCILCSLVMAFLPGLPLLAESPRNLEKRLMELPAGERQQYQIALEKALASQAVASAAEDREAAEAELAGARKEAILAKNESSAALLDKAEDAPRSLTPKQRKQLREAQASVRSEPAVRSAQAKVFNAQKRYREALNEALLEIDPTLASVLEKLNPKKKTDEEIGPVITPAPTPTPDPASPAPKSGAAE